jgi:hypothetical protein
VSTNFVPIGWLLQAAYANKPNDLPLKLMGGMCGCAIVLAATTLGKPSLPSPLLVPNAAWSYYCAPCPTGPNPYSALLTNLALPDRRALAATRIPSSLAARCHWLKGQSLQAQDKRTPLFVLTGAHSRSFLGQVECRVADIIDWKTATGRAQLYPCRQVLRARDHPCIVTQ